jgi:HEPN domain-containing protein
MSEHRAWLRQAQSDRESAERVLDRGDTSTFCHAIAKFQQAVEKSINALVVALRDYRGLGVVIGWTHTVEPFMGVLTRLPRSGGRNREIQSLLHGLLDERTRGAIRALDQLAPRRPPPGVPPHRNTEYPFLQEGEWCAPADLQIFTRSDVDRFRALAARIVGGCARLISAIERAAR